MARTAPRRRWPPGVLRGVVAELMRGAPRHLLQRALWGGAGSAADALRRGRAYGRSIAVMSMVGRWHTSKSPVFAWPGGNDAAVRLAHAQGQEPAAAGRWTLDHLWGPTVGGGNQLDQLELLLTCSSADLTL